MVTDENIAFFGVQFLILAHCGIKFSTFLFLHHVFTFLQEFYKSIWIRYRLPDIITILSFVANGIFKRATSKVIIDLHVSAGGKRKREGFQRLGNPDYSSQKVTGKFEKNSVNKKTSIQGSIFWNYWIVILAP